jgi:hypothetical protein
MHRDLPHGTHAHRRWPSPHRAPWIVSPKGTSSLAKALRYREVMPRHAKSTKYLRDTRMIAGLDKYRAKLKNLQLGTGLDTPDSVAARFQAHLDAMQAVAANEVAWRVAIQREQQLEIEIKRLIERTKFYLRSLFGAKSATLREFGLKPQAKSKVSTETALRAVEKRRETRRLRRTMGKKQKKA